MSKSDSSNSIERSGGFSLSSLALLVTACAVFLTAIDIHFLSEQIERIWSREPLSLVLVFLGAALIGAIVGIVRLFVDGFSWRLLVFAPLVGCLVSVVAVLVLLAPGPLWRTLLAVGMLLAATNVLRLSAE
jgi:hypothetical protein